MCKCVVNLRCALWIPHFSMSMTYIMFSYHDKFCIEQHIYQNNFYFIIITMIAGKHLLWRLKHKVTPRPITPFSTLSHPFFGLRYHLRKKSQVSTCRALQSRQVCSQGALGKFCMVPWTFLSLLVLIMGFPRFPEILFSVHALRIF